MGHGCLFHVHVYKGTFYIGILGLLISTFILGWCIFFRSFIVFAIESVSFVDYIGLIIGVHIESLAMIWPFLLLQPLVIFFEFFFCFISFVVIGSATFLNAKEINSDADVRTLIHVYPNFFQAIDELALGFTVFLVVVAFLQIYFYSVVS
ncbi:hypothetical protein M3Y98_01171300 [Aphelenchoides besseyi]|nr:hypothetical protein M3Y98_01171300 [Aphelenchoides besseyi]KAI6210970.1 hypothetical protein M3Y96_00383900 [Aphelenchoides besseyi]